MSRAKLVRLLLLMLFMVSASYFCTTLPDVLSRLLGWLGVCLFGLGLILLLLRLFRHRRGADSKGRDVVGRRSKREASEFRVRRHDMAADITTLMAKIDEALAGVERHGGDRLSHMASIKKQLLWCLDYLRGAPPFPLPGPFSMGLLATRNLDMYGDDPELATLINKIETEMNSILHERREA